MTVRDKEKVVFEAEFIRQSNKAVLVEIDGEEHWIPESQIHDDSEAFVGCDLDKGDACKLICSEWIAKEKGLL